MDKLALSPSTKFVNNSHPHKNERCFYYWKSIFTLNNDDIGTLNRHQIKKIYLKFFDVAWDPLLKTPIPVAEVNFKSSMPKQIAIVPTIFITNESLSKIQELEIPLISNRIAIKVQEMAFDHNLPPISEIQIDCDWTKQTQKKYFQLLQALKEYFHTRIPSFTKITATVRLHQIKYAKFTGIPPVDGGVLMFYNMTHFNHWDTENSILNVSEGKRYLTDIASYPIPLDIALPIYSMGVIFQGPHYVGLLKDLTADDIKINNQRDRTFSIQSPNRFVALKDIYFRGMNIYKNDLIRIEDVSYDQLLQATSLLGSRITSDDRKIILFHFDRNLMEKLGHENIENIFHSFNQN